MAQETQTMIVKRCEHDEFEVQVPLYLTGDDARDAALRLAERYRNAHMVNLLNEGVVLLARSKTWTAGPTEGKDDDRARCDVCDKVSGFQEDAARFCWYPGDCDGDGGERKTEGKAGE